MVHPRYEGWYIYLQQLIFGKDNPVTRYRFAVRENEERVEKLGRCAIVLYQFWRLHNALVLHLFRSLSLLIAGIRTVKIMEDMVRKITIVLPVLMLLFVSRVYEILKLS